MSVAATGESIVALARSHIRESYVFGARAPMANPKWKGPWDCAEFASWCVFQATGILYGARPSDDPVLADAFTGFWLEQAKADGAIVTPTEAASIEGALLIRAPLSGRIGHIVISNGAGGTVEAHSSKDGVIAGIVTGRVWDVGVLVPGVQYFKSQDPVALAMPENVLRLTSPLTKGKRVARLQRELNRKGFHPGSADGVYGPQTASAVLDFQRTVGLVADGEAGPMTLKQLGL